MLSLTYVSSASADLDVDALLSLLADVRPQNEAAGVTGMLLYSDGNIIQTLEGPDDAVDDVFRSIQHDPRHRGIILILREEIRVRAFPDWSMGFRRYRRDELDGTPGLNSFMNRGADEPEAGAAHHLLEMFRQTMR